MNLQIVYDFIKIKTPKSWSEQAAKNLDILLLDHAHCERKAAAAAINLISKYPERRELVEAMSSLAREELLHFEKVRHLMGQKNIPYGPLEPCGYASVLHHQVTRKNCIQRLCDQLLVGAIIEARSCERFDAVLPFIDDASLKKFYSTLIKSEARHFEDYLNLARLYGGDIQERLDFFLTIENDLICSEDKVFRFHSGIPEEVCEDPLRPT